MYEKNESNIGGFLAFPFSTMEYNTSKDHTKLNGFQQWTTMYFICSYTHTNWNKI